MQLSFWDLYSLFDKEYNSVIKEAAEKTGLTMNELGVLLFLSNNPSAKTASDIIRIKKATKSHVSLAVKELTKKGYLTQHPEKGRNIRLEVTPPGRTSCCGWKTKAEGLPKSNLPGVFGHRNSGAEDVL